MFGVPLEYLVEREGVDSMLGASRTAVQIPSFIDDVISAMRQMGACASARIAYRLLTRLRRYVRRGYLPS